MTYILDKFSVSKLGCFITCPFQFQCKYVLKLPSEEESKFAAYGSALHEILENINIDIQKGILLRSKDYDQLIRTTVEKFKLETGSWMKFSMYVSDYISKITSYIGFSKVVGVEQGFNLPFQANGKTYTFTGFIDLLTLKDSLISVYDFKSKVKPTLATELMLTRDLQVQSYSWLVSKYAYIQRGTHPKLLFSQEPSNTLHVERYGHIQFIDKDQSSNVIWNDKFDYSEIVKRIRYYLYKIEECISENYFPRNPSFCGYCDHKNYCLKESK